MVIAPEGKKGEDADQNDYFKSKGNGIIFIFAWFLFLSHKYSIAGF